MEFLNNYHKISHAASEWDMQSEIDSILKSHCYTKFDGRRHIVLPKIVLREFRVPEVNRISDHVILLDNKRVINIECKKDDLGGVIHQAKDHLKWCDYSVIVVPPDGRYIANSYKSDCIRNGIGMWYWFRGIGIFEFILPSYNKTSDKVLRECIIKRIKLAGEVNA